MRKIEVPTDILLGDTAADIQWRMEESKAREREEEPQKQKEEARRDETGHSKEQGVAEKHTRTDKSDTEMDSYREGEGEAGTSQSHSRHKGHMTNIFLMDSDEEAIVDFGYYFKLFYFVSILYGCF